MQIFTARLAGVFDRSRRAQPATITLQRLGLMGGECCVGNAGSDLLKAAGFTIDFSAMTLRLER